MRPPGQLLTGQDLRSTDLSAVNLANADLRAADLRGVDLSGRNLSGADLRNARLNGALLVGAQMADVELGGAVLDGADLSRADLRRSDGLGLHGHGLSLVEAQLEGAEWRHASLKAANFDGAQGRGMRLDAANLEGASFRDAELPLLVLDDAFLDATVLDGATLSRAAMVGVQGSFSAAGADLRGADLRGVPAWCLEGADLKGARLRPMSAVLREKVQERSGKLRERLQRWQEQRQAAAQRKKEEEEAKAAKGSLPGMTPPATDGPNASEPPPDPVLTLFRNSVERARQRWEEETKKPLDERPIWRSLQGAYARRKAPISEEDMALRLELRALRARQDLPVDEGNLVPRESLPEFSERELLQAVSRHDIDLRLRFKRLLADRAEAPVEPDLRLRLQMRSASLQTIDKLLRKTAAAAQAAVVPRVKKVLPRLIPKPLPFRPHFVGTVVTREGQKWVHYRSPRLSNLFLKQKKHSYSRLQFHQRERLHAIVLERERQLRELQERRQREAQLLAERQLREELARQERIRIQEQREEEQRRLLEQQAAERLQREEEARRLAEKQQEERRLADLAKAEEDRRLAEQRDQERRAAELARERQRLALLEQQALQARQKVLGAMLPASQKLADESWEETRRRLAAEKALQEQVAAEEARREALAAEALLRARERAHIEKLATEARLSKEAQERLRAQQAAERAEEAARLATEKEQKAQLLLQQQAAERDLARQRAEQAAAALAEKQEAARQTAEAEAQRQQILREQTRLRAEADAQRQREEGEVARIRAEQEAARSQAEAEATRIRVEQEAARVHEERERARIAAEAEAARAAVAREAARLKAKVEAEAEAARIREEKEGARLLAEATRRREEQERADARARAEAEAARIYQEQEEARLRAKAEAEEEAARVREARRRARQAAKAQAEAEAEEQRRRRESRQQTEAARRKVASEESARRAAAEAERRREARENWEREQRLRAFRQRALAELPPPPLDPRPQFRRLVQASAEQPDWADHRYQARKARYAARQRQLRHEQLEPLRQVAAAVGARLLRQLRAARDFWRASPENRASIEDELSFRQEAALRERRMIQVQRSATEDMRFRWRAALQEKRELGRRLQEQAPPELPLETQRLQLRLQLRADEQRLRAAQTREQAAATRRQKLLLQKTQLDQQELSGDTPDQRQKAREQELAAQQSRRREARLQRAGIALRRSARAFAGALPAGARWLQIRLEAPPLPPLLPGADLRGCRLEDLDLRGKDLRGAQFQRASLVGADLRGADLRGADLSEADLTDARLSGANMRDVCLDRAILDQTLMDGVDLTGASFEYVQAQSVRGLDSVTRARIRAQAATHNEDRVTLASAAIVAGTLAAGLLLYLGVQWIRQDEVDPGKLEQAASDAQRTGRTGEASENFAALAAQQELPDQKVNFLLEAASAAEESKDPARTLELLELAMAAAAEGPMEVTVRLRLARAQARAELRTDAEAQYRSLLDRIDLEPTQRAEALVGLAGTLTEGQDAEVTRLQTELLESGATDLERSALALALADGWAAMARPESALAAIQLALDLVISPPERANLQLRQARLMVDAGDSDGALALYQKLMQDGGTPGMDARLGGAELLQRRGKGEESELLLKPLLESDDEDRKAYARIILASVVAARGDESQAVNLLKTVLASSALSPRRMDEARLMLGRLLVRSDPDAAASLAAENPMLHEEMLLGQARALREAGQRSKAREIWVELVDGEKTSEDARTEAQLSLADLQLEEGDPEGALRRFEALLERTTTATLRQRIVLGMADALVRMGRLQEAEVKYEGLIPVAPEDLAMRCRLGLARTAALRGQNDRASRLYLEVAGMDGPWAVEALLSLAELRERGGDHAGAIQALRLARTRPGAEAERRTAVDIALAAILAEQGDPEATKLYGTLLEAPDPGVRTQARLAVGQQLLTEDPALALTRFDEAVSEAPTPELRAEARAGWLRAALATGQATAAVERAQAWLAAESDSQRRGELVLGVVAALHTEGRLEEAASLGERYLVEGGFELAMELSGVYRERGQLDQSIRTLQAAKPTSVEDKVWQGETLLEDLLLASRWTEAESLCEKLGKLPGGQAVARFGKARVLREQGRLEEALSLMGELEDPRVPIEKAAILQALGRDEEAELLFRRMLLASEPESRSAGQVGLGRVLLERGDAAEALKALDQGPVEEAFALSAAQVRGEALLALGKLPEAKAVYAALQGDAEARTVGALGLGNCALAADDPVGARAWFEQAQVSPDRYYQAHALAGLVRTAAEAGDPSKAGELLLRLKKDYEDRADAIAQAEASVE